MTFVSTLIHTILGILIGVCIMALMEDYVKVTDKERADYKKYNAIVFGTLLALIIAFMLYYHMFRKTGASEESK
jgi:Na+-translocating ferredoxin:NAD+ oxidoreductase RnfD subunit